jgi:transcriptional regulator GlxA family with amidase domain
MARIPFSRVFHGFLHHQGRKNPLSASDEEFLARFREIVAQHHSDRAFTTQVAAESVAVSRMHLNRKLQALTGKSTHEFIRAMRLEAARDLLQMPLSVEFIARAVGFKSSSHFAKAFRQKFGVRPSKYRTLKSQAREPPRARSPGK